MNIAQVEEIIDIAIAVNGFGERRASSGLPTVFVDVAGHIAVLEVQIYETGWERGKAGCDRRFKFDLDMPLDQGRIEEYKEYMAKIMPPIGLCEEDVEYV